MGVQGKVRGTGTGLANADAARETRLAGKAIAPRVILKSSINGPVDSLNVGMGLGCNAECKVVNNHDVLQIG